MNRSFVLTAIALGAAALGGGARAAHGGAVIGAVRSHHSLEHYDMSVGVTAGQQPRRAVRFDEDREVFTVPVFYGALVGVTSDAGTTVLWFRDGDNALRNAVVPEAAHRSYKIQTGATSRYEVELREQ
jgi:hypothetical protein